MKIYITKYATTKGILEADGIETSFPGMVRTGNDAYFNEGEWFNEFPSALKNAIERQVKKIKSLNRNLKKVQTMDLTKIEKF